MLFNVVIFISYFYSVFTELALPSYEYDHGHCPLGTKQGEDCGYVDRWFIDIRDHTCKPFEYKKSGGNFNNFATQSACKRHLILTHNEKSEGCQETPALQGPCILSTDSNQKIYKYTFFRTKTSSNNYQPTKAGDCVRFEYSGCGGNHNRYDTNEECIQACRNTKNGGLQESDLTAFTENERGETPNKFDCFVKPDVKDENPPVHPIADLNNKRCVLAATAPDTETTRRGVFSSITECVTKCYPNDDDKIEACRKTTPDQYEQGTNEANESNIEVRYYYNKDTKRCIRFESWKGEFDTTKNNFPSIEICMSYCGAEQQPTELIAEETCLLNKQSIYDSTQIKTIGNLNVDRFYYDKETNQCDLFKYGGIGGNSNNFKTINECNKVCRDELWHLDLSTQGNRCPNSVCPPITN